MPKLFVDVLDLLSANPLFMWFLGLMSTPILRWTDWLFFGPKLELYFDSSPHCVVDTQLHIATVPLPSFIHARYFRIRVTNAKRNVARSCRAYLTKVEKLDDERFRPVAYFDTMPLNWSYRNDEEATEGIDIPYKTSHYVDVVGTQANRGPLILRTKPEAICYEDLLTEPGVYRFTVHVCADAIQPVFISFRLKFSGKWDSASVF